jgi:hypothetical protein
MNRGEDASPLRGDFKAVIRRPARRGGGDGLPRASSPHSKKIRASPLHGRGRSPDLEFCQDFV